MEIIVVIDGPEPDTVKALEGLHKPRLRVIELQKNVGGNGARNVGVQEAKGEWIAFLDDDDEWLAEKTERQIAFLADSAPGTNFVVCRTREVDTGFVDRVWPREFPRPGENWSEYLYCRGGFPDTSAYLVKRQLMIEVPFLEGISSGEDCDWLLRVNATGKLVAAWLGETLEICHNDSDAATRTGKKADWDRFYQWVLERRTLLTPKAFSYALVKQGVPRIKRTKGPVSSSFRNYLRLFSAAAFKGKIDLRLCAYCFALLFLNGSTRGRLRVSYECARTRMAKLFRATETV
jgi:glycosyltransferase involved in cell wall biosynthesis